MVSICDSMNYITEPEDLETVFRLVNNYLDPGGIFIFDLNTVYKYRELLGEQTIAENREDASFIWDNFYYEEERINEYDLTLFIQEDASIITVTQSFTLANTAVDVVSTTLNTRAQVLITNSSPGGNAAVQALLVVFCTCASTRNRSHKHLHRTF